MIILKSADTKCHPLFQKQNYVLASGMRHVVMIALLFLPAAALASGIPTPADHVLRIPGTAPDSHISEQSDPHSLILRALAADLEGNTVAAKDLFAAAVMGFNTQLAKNPNDIDALNGRALARIRNDDPGGRNDAFVAKNLLTEQIDSNPPDGMLYYKRGTSYRLMQIFDLATADFEKAIALRPDMTSWAFELRSLRLERSVQSITELDEPPGE